MADEKAESRKRQALAQGYIDEGYRGLLKEQNSEVLKGLSRGMLEMGVQGVEREMKFRSPKIPKHSTLNKRKKY